MISPDNALLDMLTRFARTLADPFDVADVLYNLTDSTVEVLGATAAGVSLADDDTLVFVSANSEVAKEIERVQQESKQGPCHEAFMTGVAVIVNDIATHDEWPVYRAAALDENIHAVMGIPMVGSHQTLGALNIYHASVREWTDDERRAAQVLTDVATSYLLHASRIDEVTQVNEQLQRALETRVVIEQAKGILAGEYTIGLDAAFEILRTHARSQQVRLHHVADGVVNLGLRPPPPPKK
jgi:GAF domain-containing protein